MQVLLKSGQAEQARKRMQRMHRLWPASGTVTLKHAEMLLSSDSPSEALSMVQRWIARPQNPKPPAPSVEYAAVLAMHARLLAVCGQLTGAMQALQDAIDMERSFKERQAAKRRSEQPKNAELLERLAKGEHAPTFDLPAFDHGGHVGLPKLHVESDLAAIWHGRLWLQDRLTEARITLASVLVVRDASLARTYADAAVKSGRMQALAHEAAAQVCVVQRDFAGAVKHLRAGLKVQPTSGSLLRSFARMLRAQGQSQDAVLVATYARGVTSKGKAPASADVRRAYAGIRNAVLGT